MVDSSRVDPGRIISLWGFWVTLLLAVWAVACAPGNLPRPLPTFTALAPRSEGTRTPPPPAGPPPVTPSPSPTPLSPAQRTLQALEQARPLLHDPRAFIESLGTPVAWATPMLSLPPTPGAREVFYVLNLDQQQARPVSARLVYAGPVAYLWVEEGLEVDDAAVQFFMQTFETEIYPTTRRYFGEEPQPGVDGDPRLHLLYVKTLEGGVAGYFSAADAQPRAVHPYSNQREMLVFSAQATNLQDLWARSLLAHEFQHMIHWAQDPNESAWINEGASELAALLNRAPVGFTPWSYLQEPDIQLNTWPDPQRTSPLPHYGAAFLFLLYFWEQLGDQALRDLVAHPANGWDGVQAVLERYQPERSYEDLFLDWLTANLLQDPTLADGRFGYQQLALSEGLAHQTITQCPTTLEGVISPFGVDVYRLDCPGTWRVRLHAPAAVPLLPTVPRSGRFAFWSNYGDGSEMRLTRFFDLTEVTPPVTLIYWTWFDLEPNYDYVYLLASRDGRTWEMLRTPSGTDANPVGNNYGWGYTGPSGGQHPPRWIREQVDLSAYAGGPLWLRFVYVTDPAVNYPGFLLDDIRLAPLDYQEDFEDEDHGWEAQGFVRVSGELPARFRWRWVQLGPQGLQVRDLPIQGGHQGQAVVRVPERGQAYLLITLLTRYTRETGPYTLVIEPEEP